jgi:hypothetical protein
VKFFFDNCLSPYLARAINELDRKNSLMHLRDRFDPATDDATWIEALAREGGWTIVAGDTRIQKNPVNREAWRRSGMTAFFFQKGFTKLLAWEQAWRAVRSWPYITQTAALIKPGAGFLVPHGKSLGKLEPIPGA